MAKWCNLALIVAAALPLSEAPLAAQVGQPTVTASNPGGIVSALEAAGYKAKLSIDGEGDPMIDTELAGWKTSIYFYGCNEETHDACDSVQFSAGFDRKAGWNADGAITLSSKYRFASVRLDDEGDPYIMWDVITGDGIPTKVFLSSVEYFTQAIENVTEDIFAEESSTEETPAEETTAA